MQNQQSLTLYQDAKPLVSFIITYYNQPIPMLCRCIDSILALALSDSEREIVIIDDGSEVSPMNGLMQYGESITYLRQKNQGLSVARNKGIEVTTGRYLQFVDADDCLVKMPYEHCLEAMRTNDSYDMVIFDFTTDITIRQATFNELPVMSGTEYMLKHNIHGTACGYLFKRTTLSELRFTPDTWHEDEEFTPQLLIRAEQLYITDAKAYYYYKHPGTITTHADEHSKSKRLDDILHIIIRLNKQCDRIPQDDRIALRRRIAQLTMDYIYQVIIQKRSTQALNNSISMLRNEGLFPLPNRDYSAKYNWFRRMTNTAIGRTVLLHSLPLLRKER